MVVGVGAKRKGIRPEIITELSRARKIHEI
jgi:hypothetical protein